MKRICVFCGSSLGNRAAYVEAAREMGQAIARHGWELVYGGSKLGLMGVTADAALEAGAKVIGVIPEMFVNNEVPHPNLTELHVVRSMHERKAMMAELSDGFVALPGGLGTFEEYCEIVTWAQLGLHLKPCGLLNVNGFYDPLLALVDRAIAEEFIRPQQRGLVLAAATIDGLFAQFEGYAPPILPKWITPDQT